MMQCLTNQCQSPLNPQVWTFENSKEGETEGEGGRERERGRGREICVHVAECKWLTGVSIHIKEGSIWPRRFLLIKLNPYPILPWTKPCVTSPSPLIWLQITLR